MKIALPIVNGELSSHFGHCEHFLFVTVDKDSKAILAQEEKMPPPHEPGVLPKWLQEQGATLVITGGMGARAQSLLEENGVSVLLGVSPKTPEALVKDYLNGSLQTGSNHCDH